MEWSNLDISIVFFFFFFFCYDVETYVYYLLLGGSEDVGLPGVWVGKPLCPYLVFLIVSFYKTCDCLSSITMYLISQVNTFESKILLSQVIDNRNEKWGNCNIKLYAGQWTITFEYDMDGK